MDKQSKEKFIEIDKELDIKLDSNVEAQIEKRKEEHYKIIQSDIYAKIIKNF
jgi:hypothetical protein